MMALVFLALFVIAVLAPLNKPAPLSEAEKKQDLELEALVRCQHFAIHRVAPLVPDFEYAQDLTGSKWEGDTLRVRQAFTVMHGSVRRFAYCTVTRNEISTGAPVTVGFVANE